MVFLFIYLSGCDRKRFTDSFPSSSHSTGSTYFRQCIQSGLGFFTPSVSLCYNSTDNTHPRGTTGNFAWSPSITIRWHWYCGLTRLHWMEWYGSTPLVASTEPVVVCLAGSALYVMITGPTRLPVQSVINKYCNPVQDFVLWWCLKCDPIEWRYWLVLELS